jgi:hypothetical protein
MDTDANTMSVSHKTYPRRCACARIYEFAMDRGGRLFGEDHAADSDRKD